MRKDLFFDLDLIKLHETNCLHHFVNPWVLCRPRGLLCYFFTNSRYTINTDSGQEVKNTPRWHFSEHVTRLFFLTILLEWKQGWVLLYFCLFLYFTSVIETGQPRVSTSVSLCTLCGWSRSTKVLTFTSIKYFDFSFNRPGHIFLCYLSKKVNVSALLSHCNL